MSINAYNASTISALFAGLNKELMLMMKLPLDIYHGQYP
jgi:hypothetical protein